MPCEFEAKGVEDTENSARTVKKTKNSEGGISAFAGWEQCSPSHRFGPAVRETYLLHYVISGKGVFWCGNEKLELGAGEGFFISPGEVTTYAADDADPWEYMWTGIESNEETSRTLRARGLRAGDHSFSFDPASPLFVTALNLTDKKNSCGHETSVAAFYLALQSIPPARRKPGDGNELIDAAYAYMDEKYSLDLSVEEMAEHLNVSRSNLYRVFMKETGISPGKAIIRLRLEKARKLMETGRFTMTQIAFSCGFCDLSHFSKALKASEKERQ